MFVSDYLGIRISSDNIVEDVIKGLDKQDLMPGMIVEKPHTKLKDGGFNEYFRFRKGYTGSVKCLTFLAR